MTHVGNENSSKYIVKPAFLFLPNHSKTMWNISLAKVLKNQIDLKTASVARLYVEGGK